MKRHLAVLASLLGVLATSVAACSGERSGSGLGEPIRVRNGAFKLGALPGPLGPGPGVTVTAIESASTVLRPGQGEKTLGGRASIGTVAVAVGLAELAAPRSSGSGYWVFPAEGPDPLNNNELGWQALVCHRGRA